MSWGVWCTVAGGVTGPRQAWLKADGVVVECDTREEAEELAQENRERMAGHRGSAQFTYTARRLT